VGVIGIFGPKRQIKKLSYLNGEAEREFNNILLQSFLECVEFGDLILRFLEISSPIKRWELAEKPEMFANGLKDLLGDSAKVKMEEIIQKLYEKIGVNFVKLKGYAFQDYIKDAKIKFIALYKKNRQIKESD